MSAKEILIQGEQLTLLHQKALYWPAEHTLIVSDLHLGKAGHFRKHGIPVSRKIHLEDIRILEQLIHQTNVKRVILLGDLFHSDENEEWNDFLEFLQMNDHVEFTLIEGNHDILNSYPETLIVVQKKRIPPFSFTHIKEEDTLYNISGHIHPGVKVRGKGRQVAVLPCFYFSEKHAILPAFGQFTGMKTIELKSDDRVFAIAAEEVIELV